MSIVDYSATAGVSGDVAVGEVRNGFHRLATVRRLQGVSRRTLARRMNVDLAEVRRQEDESSDLPLSVLYEWQKALDVPVAELLSESDDALSQALTQRAQLVRLMKTAMALQEQAEKLNGHGVAARRAAKRLVEQLVEIMPELRDVSAWHAVGKRRRVDEVGVTALRTLSEEFFVEWSE